MRVKTAHYTRKMTMEGWSKGKDKSFIRIIYPLKEKNTTTLKSGSSIYMVETKSQRDMNSEDVAKKTEAAIKYCADATSYTAANDGKPWKYLLIPHDAVLHNMSFAGLAGNYEVKR